MPLSRIKVWEAEEELTAADLNEEFDNIIENATDLFSPATGDFDMDGNSLIWDQDGDTYFSASTDDTLNLAISGVNDFQFTANTFTALSGSSISVISGNITVNSGNLTLASGNATVTAGDLTVTNGQTTLADPDARTNTVASPLIIGAETSGTPAAGIGTQILLKAESADEVPSNLVAIGGTFEDVTAGSEDSSVIFQTRAAGAALSPAYYFRKTNTASAIFTHAFSSDRTFTLPNLGNTTLVGEDTAQALTNKTINAASNTITNINTTALKTSTGSAAGTNAAQLVITLNDYAFFPAFFNSNAGTGNSVLTTGDFTDPANTVGHIALNIDTATDGSNHGARWRYVTASDDGTIWIARHNVTGVIMGVWTSDDPTPDGLPGIVIKDCTSTLLKSEDLEQWSLLSTKVSEADAFIKDHKLKSANLAWRALQLVANDVAPADWLMKNLEVKNDQLNLKGSSLVDSITPKPPIIIIEEPPVVVEEPPVIVEEPVPTNTPPGGPMPFSDYPTINSPEWAQWLEADKTRAPWLLTKPGHVWLDDLKVLQGKP